MEASAVRLGRRIVVFGWGNPSRGDDALGPLFIERLGAQPLHPEGPQLHLVAAQQLQVEHALELQACDMALFVDAAVGLPGPYVFRPLLPVSTAAWSTHTLEPAELLNIGQQTLGYPQPPAFMLQIGGIDFEFGHPLSPSAEANLELALAFIERLLTFAVPAGAAS